MKEHCNVNNELKNLSSHISCKQYVFDRTTGFYYQEVEPTDAAAEALGKRIMEVNVLLFLLEGELELSYDSYQQRRFTAGDMVLLPKATVITGRCLQPARMICFGFNTLLNPCDKLHLRDLHAAAADYAYDFQPLAMNEPMLHFVSGLEYYIRRRAICLHLQELKHKEFFVILRFFYTTEQLVALLYPLLAKSFDMKNWVLDHYRQYPKAADLIAASHMSRSVFLKAFKEEFHLTPHQWLTQQLCQRLREAALEPNVTVKDLMRIADVEDYSQFARFCKREFNCTPKELIAHTQ